MRRGEAGCNAGRPSQFGTPAFFKQGNIGEGALTWRVFYADGIG